MHAFFCRRREDSVGKDYFTSKITLLLRVKQRKKIVRWNIKVTRQGAFAIYVGFHIINPATLSLVLPTSESLDRPLAHRLMSKCHRLCA